MSTDNPPKECTNCGSDYEATYRDCPNCGEGFFMPPVSDEPACADCGEPFDEAQYECPGCGTSLLPV